MSTDTLNVAPPVAEKRPVSTTLHGETRIDDYHWLREKEKPDVIAYLEAENRYSDARLQSTGEFQKALYAEMLARIQETDLSVPYRRDGWWYYSRTEQGKQYPIYCRKFASLDAEEQVTLNLNEMAVGEKFLSLGAYAVSDDGNLLAYTTDVTGFRLYTLRIKNLQTGELLPDVIEKVSGGVAWAADGKTLFYGTEDAAKRPYRIYRHTVGEANNEQDVLVYEEPDALYRAYIQRSRDKKYFFILSGSAIATEYHVLSTGDPMGTLRCVRPREPEHEYYIDHRDGLFYVRTNKNAVNFRLVTTPASAPDLDTATEVIPHRPEAMLEDHDCFARHLVLSERQGGLPQLHIRDMHSWEGHLITFPEPTYTLSGEINAEFDTELFRFRYASLITPPSVYDYNMATRERTLLKETPVLGGYDRSLYTSEFLHATAPDGTPIPISIVYRKGLVRDGNAPCLLYGYGSYGISMPAGFNSNRLSLLDRGVVFAIAHIRGGGELGKPWHDAGKMQFKQNTFSDFIACAEYLIAQGYTSSARLAIMGGSAGGLLMGAVCNQRPDLFHAVVSQVPFVDVLNTMLDDTLPLTVGEYLEWGNPNVADEYAVMRKYCPYTNLEAKAYPTMLVRTSLNDSQVMYWEPAKYVAKLRTLKTDDNDLLLHINMEAGHGGASGRYDALRETALDYAFLLSQWGIQ